MHRFMSPLLKSGQLSITRSQLRKVGLKEIVKLLSWSKRKFGLLLVKRSSIAFFSTADFIHLRKKWIEMKQFLP